MDQGKAALYAAIIGFAAAVIGAGVGGWASYRGSRHQVVGGAKNEHMHWIRQERRLAYGRVIQATISFSMHEIDLFHRTLERLASSEPSRADADLIAFIRQQTELSREVTVACEELFLFGPQAVQDQGLVVIRSSNRVVRAITAVATSSDPTREAARQEYDDAKSELSTSLGAFTRLCREELVTPEAL